ncbi:MAG: hypothetical protein IJD77_05940 [Clostridia bacterium]|nr:hypothetical protein [Clostridia bacterium]
MKKLFTLALSAVCAFSLVACGDKNKANHGSTISSQEAQALMAGVKAKNETLSAQDLTKLTYTLKTKMDDSTTTSTHKFSKEDNYIYDNMLIENSDIYKEDNYIYDNMLIENSDIYYGYEEPYKEYIGTIHQSVLTNYFYIDENGRAIKAKSEFENSTMKNEDTGVFETKIDSDSYYTVHAETLEESEKVFHNSIFTQLSDLMTQLLNYSSQMIQTFEPLLEMGTTSIAGMTIEIKSKGEGHLYMKQDMSNLGTYYECEYNDYMLTYMKMIIDNAKTGITASGYSKMTTEMRFQIGVCDISYPNLDSYTNKTNA